MLLREIKARQLLSFGPPGIDLELRPLNILIGPNGCGKSNLIEAIGLLRADPPTWRDWLAKAALAGEGQALC
jgi:predicted ATPase